MILIKFCLKNHIFLKMSGDTHIKKLLDQDFFFCSLTTWHKNMVYTWYDFFAGVY